MSIQGAISRLVYLLRNNLKFSTRYSFTDPVCFPLAHDNNYEIQQRFQSCHLAIGYTIINRYAGESQ